MNWFLATVSAATIVAALPASALAQDNATVVGEVRRILAENYVIVDKRAALDAALTRGLASGRYSGIEGPVLAERVAADLDAVAHDPHPTLRYAPAEAATIPAPRDDDAEADASMNEQARRWNQGVTELRVLDGNIRYMNYRGFMWAGRDGGDSAAAITTAMAFLRGGDAIVIDLRENGGGDPRAVRRLASYFVAGGTPLVTFHVRSRPPEIVRAERRVAGGTIVHRPVYVLTSSATLSAAEEFASHASRLGFGTLVGAGVVSSTLASMLADREEERARMEAELAREVLAKIPVVPHPALLARYEAKVARISEALADPQVSAAAAQIIRSLIQTVTVHVAPDGTRSIEVEALTSTLMAFAATTNAPQRRATGAFYKGWLRGQD